ncbi:MAG: kelch repeat-containing protein [Candidatus Limnocylindrales bacterium]
MRRIGISIMALAVIIGWGHATAAPGDAHPDNGAFEPAGTVKSGLLGHVATTLPDGRVLIVGGEGRRGTLDSARVWDPSTASSRKSGPLNEARTLAAGVTLTDGRVLIVGGEGRRELVATAELWDPVSGTFSLAGELEEARVRADAIVLGDGRVAVIGGSGSGDVRRIEVWDPQVAGFRTAGVMPESRMGHASVLLSDGRVLITGGESERGPLDTALLWDPASGDVTEAGQMLVDRYDHSATLLPDGRVIIIGGWTKRGTVVTAAAEIWDPVTNTFVPAGSMAERRAWHTATPLPDGRVLVVGGGDYHGRYPVAGEIWEPELGRFILSGPLAFGREGHTASLLPDGRVLVVGGRGWAEVLTRWESLEVWDPNAVPETAAPPASLTLAACASDEAYPGTTALLRQFPADLEGTPLEALACAGPAWLEMHDRADPDSAATIERAETLVGSVGRSVDDLTVAVAVHEPEPGRIATITALQVEGAQAQGLTDPAIALLLGIERLDKRYRYVGQDRIPVSEVRDETIPDSRPVTMYAPVGDTLWFVTTDEPELLERIIEALPGPGGRLEVPEPGVAVTFPPEWIVSALGLAGTPEGNEAPHMGPEALVWPVAVAHPPGKKGSDETCGLSLFTSTDITPMEAFERLLPDRPGQERPVPEVLDGGLLRVAGPGSLLGESGEVAIYVLGADDAIAQLRCSAPEAPSDQWLALARTVEILAAAE